MIAIAETGTRKEEGPESETGGTTDFTTASTGNSVQFCAIHGRDKLREVRTAPPRAMTSRSAAVYGVGAALLVACLAAANMPSQDPEPRERPARPTGTAGT